MNAKLIMGMIKPFITPKSIQAAITKLMEFIREKQATEPGCKYKIVLEPTDDETDVIITIWLYHKETKTNRQVNLFYLSALKAEHITDLLKDA